MVNRIAIIPARGGSKRVPNKNVRVFLGRPLIHWTIQAAVKSSLFDRVLVSTDCPMIASTAEASGVAVPFLRRSHADDLSPVSVATISALDEAEKYWGETYDEVFQLLPTCPLRNAEDIVSAASNFEESSSDFQISCSQFMGLNPWWALTLDEKFKATSIFPGALTQRSQDLPDLYSPSGAIWVARSESLKESRTFYGPRHSMFPINCISGFDIDTEIEFIVAESLAHGLRRSKKTLK